MLCEPSGTEAGLADSNRLYELKLDGVRILAERDGVDVGLWYRTHRPAATSYPEIVRAMRSLIAERVVLDGEILAFDDSGRPSFHRLARRIHALRPRDAAAAALEVPVVYVVFDVLQIGDRDLRGVPLIDRKQLLERLVPEKGVIRRLDHFEGSGQALFAFCKEQGLEGVVGKRKDGPYRPGPKRSSDWTKFKCEREADFVVVGWLEGKGGGQKLASLELATYAGDRLVLRGRVGSGLTDSTIRELSARLAKLEVDRSPAEGKANRVTSKRHFARPEIVVSVQFAGWTEEGGLRHPRFRGVRADVDARDCTQAPAGEILDQSAPEHSPPEPPPPPHRGRRTPGLTPREGRVAVTNRDKVFWPDEGYTKGELVDYYAAVSDVMLPLLAERPIVLVRYPDGIYGKSFYQWNVPQGTPSWLRTLRFRDDEGKEGKNTFIVEDGDGLVYIANLGCIPIHILGCRASSVEHCDFLTIDFDLGGRPFKDAVTLALTLKRLLDELGLVGYPKTSGQSGLHVLIPVGPGVPFDAAKLLLELIGRLVQVQHAELSTLERRVSARGDRVYIDTGQTGRSRTIVAPYSVRAHPGATVSMPLFWDEVHLALDPTRYTLFTALDAIAERGDPMAGFQDARPDISGAMSRLDAKLAQWGLRT
jgi:bifunctional non-homologous end joining protein LigD